MVWTSRDIAQSAPALHGMRLDLNVCPRREANKALVEVLQSYIAEGRPLEAAFSRARSFSKKLKRHGGQFVPRGYGSQSADAAMAAVKSEETKSV